MKRSNNSRGICIMSVSWSAVAKGRGSHTCRRPKAIASAKVGRVVRYHAVLRPHVIPCALNRGACRGMREERRRSAGVGRAIARAGPGRGVAIPSWARAASPSRPSSSAGHTRAGSAQASPPEWSPTRPAVCSVRAGRGSAPSGAPPVVSPCEPPRRWRERPPPGQRAPWSMASAQPPPPPPAAAGAGLGAGDGLGASASVEAEEQREPRQAADASSHGHGATARPCPAAPAPHSGWLPQRPAPGQATNARQAAASATPGPSRAAGDGLGAPRSARRDPRLAHRAGPCRGQPRREAPGPSTRASAGHGLCPQACARTARGRGSALGLGSARRGGVRWGHPGPR